jgi:vacuolar-type H+-ATPase subunit C/Vma6
MREWCRLNEFTINQLEKLGKLQRIKVPNFAHKNTQEEYNSKLHEIEQNLSEIQEKLNRNLNRVQLEILKICKTKILEVFKYYLNTHTWKINKQKNRIFKKYIRELKNFKRKYFGTSKKQIDLIDVTIERIVHDFIAQRNYIMKLEKKIKSKKISPFEDEIEILDNSIRRVVS